MKVEKLAQIKTNYSFEAPLKPARIKNGRAPKLEDIDRSLDLNAHLVPDASKIFLVRVSGESMIDEKIFDGDILIVDRTETPRDGKIVIASLNGEMAVKRLKRMNGEVYLVSANKNYLPIKIGELMEFEIQGVVKHVIHSL
jgi:DNA polymerase V